MKDILPEDQSYWNFLKKNIRYRLREASFRRVYISLVDDIALKYEDFSKKSANFQDSLICLSGEKKRYLLSELASGMIRSYIENKFTTEPKPFEIYAIEPVFSQNKDELLHDHLFDYEIIGEKDAALDAQLIHRMYRILSDCGLKDEIVIEINQTGDEASRNKINQALYDFYFDKIRTVPKACRELFEQGKYLELLAYPDEDLEILAKMAPKIADCLDEEDQRYFSLLKDYLEELKIPFKENIYYVNTEYNFTGPVFRIIDKTTEAVLATGGRYDDMVKSLGGDSEPICGARGYMSKIVEAMKIRNFTVPFKDKVQIYVAQLGPRAKKKSLSLISDLRDTGIHTMGSVSKSGISAQLEMATRFKADYCLLMGEQEVLDKMILIKDLKKGNQERVKFKDVVQLMIEKIGKENIVHFRDLEE